MIRARRRLAAAAGALVSASLSNVAWLAALRPSAALAQAPDPVLPRAQDLRRDAEQVRRDRKPLLLFFSTPGCPYCREVRRGYLAPRAAEADPDVLIREVDITSTRSFTGIDGSSQREADLAATLGVRLVPAVRLVDDRLAPLAAPLVGWNDSGFYESYLQNAIDEARGKLRSR